MTDDPRPRALHLELDRYPSEAVETLRAAFRLEDGSDLTGPAVREALAADAYEVLFVRLGLQVDAALLAASPTLRTVVTPTTGLDHLDLAALHERGVRVISLRDAPKRIMTVHATAEHTWALLLACMRSLPQAVSDVTQGNWRRAPFLGTELAGRTLGVVGHGRLGSRVAGYGRAFGMDVLAHDVDPGALVDLPERTTAVDADTLLTRSDVVSLHLPLTPDTRGWLDRRRIGLLRPGAVVINTARGELVDEQALAEALVEGRIGGVGVDVIADDATWEGRTGRSPLLPLLGTGANLVVTPHIGGWARDSIAATRRLITELAVAAH